MIDVMLRSFHVVMMMISLLVIISNFLGGGTAPFADPCPAAGTAELKISTSEYLRYASKCAISRLNHQKFSWEGGDTGPSPNSTSRHLCPLSCIHIHIYAALMHMQQNFKISRPTSEYLRCASKCAISRLNNQKFPYPDPCPKGTAQNKISVSEYLRYASKCAISRLKIGRWVRGGGVPSP